MTRTVDRTFVRVPTEPPVDVHSASWGDRRRDGTILVCIHGLGGSHLNWSLLGPRLAAHPGIAAVVAPDLAGFGLTAPQGRSSDVRDNLELAAAFVRAVAGGRRIALLGNSMGGFLALQLAARHPELVDRLVLVAPASPQPVDWRIDLQVAARFAAFALPRVGEAFLARTKANLTPEQQARETMELCFADPARIDEDALAAHAELARRRRTFPYADAAFLAAARSLLRELSFGRGAHLQAVAAVRAPTLVLHGARDRLVPLRAVRDLVAARPDWDLRVYDELGHVPMLEDPERVADDVLRWLRVATGR